MAFWVLYRHSWFKRPIGNMSYYYKEYVLKSPEQRAREAEQARKSVRNFMCRTNAIYGMLRSSMNNEMMISELDRNQRKFNSLMGNFV